MIEEMQLVHVLDFARNVFARANKKRVAILAEGSAVENWDFSYSKL